MPTKPIDRLMFVQGNCCFFCRQPLRKEQATVEHLVASSRGGSNADDNCVACCATVNRLLGSMSVKDKFRVILNHQGKFRCPNGVGSSRPLADPVTPPQVITPTPVVPPGPAVPRKAAAPSKVVAPVRATTPPAAVATTTAPQPNDLLRIAANLKKQGQARPATLATLTNAVASLLRGTPDTPVQPLVTLLLTEGYVQVDGKKLSYPRWETTSGDAR